MANSGVTNDQSFNNTQTSQRLGLPVIKLDNPATTTFSNRGYVLYNTNDDILYYGYKGLSWIPIGSIQDVITANTLNVITINSTTINNSGLITTLDLTVTGTLNACAATVLFDTITPCNLLDGITVNGKLVVLGDLDTTNINNSALITTLDLDVTGNATIANLTVTGNLNLCDAFVEIDTITACDTNINVDGGIISNSIITGTVGTFTTSVNSPIVNATTGNIVTLNSTTITNAGLITTLNENVTGTLNTVTINNSGLITTVNENITGTLNTVTINNSGTITTLNEHVTGTLFVNTISPQSGTTTTITNNLAVAGTLTVPTINATTSITTPILNATTINSTNINNSNNINTATLSASSSITSVSGTINVLNSSTINNSGTIGTSILNTNTLNAGLVNSTTILNTGNVTVNGTITANNSSINVMNSNVINNTGLTTSGSYNITTTTLPPLSNPAIHGITTAGSSGFDYQFNRIVGLNGLSLSTVANEVIINKAGNFITTELKPINGMNDGQWRYLVGKSGTNDIGPSSGSVFTIDNGSAPDSTTNRTDALAIADNNSGYNEITLTISFQINQNAPYGGSDNFIAARLVNGTVVIAESKFMVNDGTDLELSNVGNNRIGTFTLYTKRINDFGTSIYDLSNNLQVQLYHNITFASVDFNDNYIGDDFDTPNSSLKVYKYAN
jgi:hypothetical protein